MEGEGEACVRLRSPPLLPRGLGDETRMKTCSPVSDSPLRLCSAQDNFTSSRKPERNACEQFWVLK